MSPPPSRRSSQPELMRILWPMFVYCHLELVNRDEGHLAREFHRRFGPDHLLLHDDDVRALSGLSTPQHAESDATARKFRDNRVPISCCQYTFDLLVKYLHHANQMALLAVLNAHISVTIAKGDPAPHTDEAHLSAKQVITGVGPPSKIDKFNAQYDAGRWGVLVDSVEVQALDEFEEEKAREERAKARAAGKPKAPDEAADDGADGGAEASQKEGGDGDKPADGDKPTPTKKKKDDKKDDDENKYEPTIVPSSIPVPELDYHHARAAVEDIRYRVDVGPAAPPSVAFYTFTHAHKFLHCCTTASDASLVVGGFADSVVRIWDINKSVPGNNMDVYCTDPESKKRKAAREEGLTLLEYEEQHKDDDVDQTMDDAEAHEGEDGEKLTANSRIARPLHCVEYVGHSSAVHGVDLSPGHDFLLSCSRDQTIRVWSMELEICLAAYKSHRFPIWDVKWCGVGHYFASASNDCTARVWAMDEAQPRRVMVGHLADVDCVAWHPNTNYIATGSSDRTVRLWDVQTGDCVRIFTGHRAGVRSLAMSPDGKSMASGSDDGGVLVWDLATAKCSHAFEGHMGAVYSLDYSHGAGTVLASGGADETVKVWDVSQSASAEVNGGEAGAAAGESKAATAARKPPMTSLRTKSTPVFNVQFTGRNLLMAMGARAPSVRSQVA